MTKKCPSYTPGEILCQALWPRSQGHSVESDLSLTRSCVPWFCFLVLFVPFDGLTPPSGLYTTSVLNCKNVLYFVTEVVVFNPVGATKFHA